MEAVFIYVVVVGGYLVDGIYNMEKSMARKDRRYILRPPSGLLSRTLRGSPPSFSRCSTAIIYVPNHGLHGILCRIVVSPMSLSTSASPAGYFTRGED
jgi:hypothetical protein